MEVRYSNTFEGDIRLVIPKIYGDDRGFFYESYRDDWFKANVSCVDFVQENCSKSCRGVVRGMHFQKEPFAQSKLVECVKGAIVDIVLDIRKESPTRGCYESFILNGYNHHQLFIPKGFAHGFISLLDDTIIKYKCDEYYHPEAESGIRFDIDNALSLSMREFVDVCLKDRGMIQSEKDIKWLPWDPTVHSMCIF